MADDVLMFDVRPKDENKLYVVFEKVSKMFEKLITVGKVANSIIDKVINTAVRPATAAIANPLATVQSFASRFMIPKSIAAKDDGQNGPFPAALPVSKGSKFGAYAAQGIAVVASKLAGAVGLIVAGAQKLANIVMGLPSLVQRLTDSLASYVQHSNPALVQRMDWAWQDLWATIGQKVAPLMEAFAQVIEKVADTIASANFSRFIDKMADAIRKTGDAFIEFLEIMIPVLEVMADIMVPLVKAFVRGMEGSMRIFRSIRHWVTGTEENRNKPGARTAALGSISVLGLEQVSNRALEAAARAGSRGDHVQNIDGNVEAMAEIMRAEWEAKRQQVIRNQMQEAQQRGGWAPAIAGAQLFF